MHKLHYSCNADQTRVKYKLKYFDSGKISLFRKITNGGNNYWKLLIYVEITITYFNTVNKIKEMTIENNSSILRTL